MYKYSFILVLSVLLFFSGCKEIIPGFDFDNLKSSKIEGLTFYNYPKVDGSTSTEPLNAVIACILFDINYRWVPDRHNLRRIEPYLNKNDTNKFLKLIKSSQTHNSYINLINKEADIILSARKMSSDEKAYADNAGVSLIETPIALDALIFIVNPYNPVNSLTTGQIHDIYTRKITNWKEVGVNDSDWFSDFYVFDNAEMRPYVRNANSGSQELMETLVMKDLEIEWFPEDYNELLVISGMVPTMDMVAWDYNAICYTVYYFKEYIVSGINVKTIAINGIIPNKETISNNSYPYVAEVYAVIRSDLEKTSMAYKLYEWLQTTAGKQAIVDSGYILYSY